MQPTLYGHEHPTTMEPTEQRIAHVVHDLKIWPTFFDAVRDGIKPFEVRKNDRHFRVGDVLQLQEWSPSTGEFTGRTLQRVVVYILAGGQFGIEEGYVVLGFDGPAQNVWHHNALMQFGAWLAKMDVLQGFRAHDGWPPLNEEQAMRVLRVAVNEYCENNRIPRP